MSKLKQKNILIILIFMLVSFFAFGCENRTPVDDIYFKLEGDQEQIVLLVGQTLEIDEFVFVQPAYASNRGFSVTSLNNSVVSAANNSITALKEGNTYIKITSNDNDKKQDIISVSVKSSVSVLSTPNNVRYNSENQIFTFNAVSNAASYSIKINDIVTNIGNSTSFSLKDYNGIQYDKKLTIQVQANAPKYSYVFKNSEFSNEVNDSYVGVYQASEAKDISVKGGILSFKKSINSDALIYLDNELITTISEGIDVSYSLRELEEEFAGTQKTLKIETKVKNSVKQTIGSNVDYKDAVTSYSTITILDAPVAVLNGSVLSWNNVLGATKYNIYVNEELAVANEANNSFDLKNLNNFNSFVNVAEGNEYKIKVMAVNEEESVNTASTLKHNPIKFNRLQTTNISVTETGVAWTEVENASIYSVTITQEGVKTSFSTNETSLDFDNYADGDYKIEVYAVANSGGDMNFLSALPKDKEFTKLSNASLSIENYVLKIGNITGENCLVKFKIDNVTTYNEIVSVVAGSENTIEIPLNYAFSAGSHTIEVVRLGNSSNDTIKSDVETYTFVQLEEISSISINNAKVSVNRGNTNKVDNATIKLETNGGTLSDPIEYESKNKNEAKPSIQFTTTYSGTKNNLDAGEYQTKVYVIGDGSETFSVRKFTTVGNDTIAELKETATLDFKVLSAPSLNFADSSKAEFTYTSIKEGNEEIANKYVIYKNGSEDGTKTKSGDEIYSYTVDLNKNTLTSETVKYKVQAIGNEANILDSNYSSEITITRIAAPELTFNNTNNVITLSYSEQDKELLDEANKYSLTFNGESSAYVFGTEYKDFVVGLNKFEVVANSVLSKDGVYYLNSNPFTLNLIKLNETTTFAIVDNKLQIGSEMATKYNLKLTFKFSDSTTATFTTNGNNLECEGYSSLPYTFSDKKYIVNLIDSNYNAIVNKFNNGFVVNVQYIQPSTAEDTIVNSDVSLDSATLNLVDLDENSEISLSNDNKLVIAPANHKQEVGIWVTFIVGGSSYEFKPNNAYGLVYEDLVLPYEYKSGKYYISLINDEYNAIFSELNSSFTAKVKYSYNNAGETTDLDSEYSSESESFNLNKLTGISTITLTANNKLEITPENQNKEVGIWVSFKVGGTSYEFKPNGNNLVVYNGVELPYEYNSNKYIVTLIDGEYNSIFEELTSAFTVKVKYSYNRLGETTDLDSSYSNESESFNLNKISNQTTFEVNTNNQLVLTPSAHSKEYFLKVTINVGGGSYEFKSNDEQNKLVYSSIELPYEYTSNKYIIDLLNANFEPIFAELNSNFSVNVQYLHLNKISDLDSDVTENKNITMLQAVTISRNEQNIVLNNVVASYTCEHYSVVVNNSIKIDLSSIATKVDNKIVVPFESIYDWVDGEVYFVAALTKNLETSVETPLVSKKGTAINVARQQTITLTSTKNNHAENNSVVVSFETYNSSCKLTYVVTISNGVDDELTKQYESQANEPSKTIRFYLDEITLEDSISITAAVLANSKTADDVNMFNSKVSNKLDINKVVAPTGIYITDSTLKFDEVENSAGYELWEKLGTGYEFYAGLIESNSYDISNWVGEKTLVLKAIANNGYTNSNFSGEFTINKLDAPVVSNVGGRLYVAIANEVVELVKQDVSVTLKIVKNNNSVLNLSLGYDTENEKLILNDSITGIRISGTTIVIEGYAVLTNASDVMVGENLKFNYIVNYDDDSLNYFYCNSNVIEYLAHGLFAPTEVKKSTSDNNSVEMLVWKENSSNVIQKIEDGETININLSLAYEFVITYTDTLSNVFTYSSTDSGLKYYNASGNLMSYPSAITAKQVAFPAGYDEGNDGTLDVVFGVGSYSIKVRTIPNAENAEYKLLSSKYSATSSFEIMDKPVLSINNGIVEWDAKTNATEYIVNIYEINGSTVSESEVVKTNRFDLSNISKTGLIEIEVKAISDREDTLNSAFSEKISAYRLPKPTSAYVDDGNLILEANKYFCYANITFRTGNISITYPYVNPNFRANLEALKEDYENANWFELLTILNTLDTPVKYVIDLNEEAMQIVSGNNYTISVQLMGNSSNSVGILNSQNAEDLSLLSFAKLTSVDVSVNMGVINFEANTAYKNKDLNYKFNNEADGSTFWNNTTVYKINLTTGGKVIELYAVDYNTFVTHRSKLNSSNVIDYNLSDLCAAVKYTNSNGTIVFNVFKNNTINLRDFDYFYYYATTSTMQNGEVTYTTTLEANNGYYRIDLNQTSSYLIDVYMLGGDSKNNVGYVTSSNCDLDLFVRYGNFVDEQGNSTLSTENGKISMPDLRQYKIVDDGDGGTTKVIVDNPVYRLIVKGSNYTKYVYLYYTTEDDAKIVASRLDANYNNAIYAPIEFSEIYENIILFNFSEYFTPGNYTINTRTLAGVGNGEDGAQHYLINSKEIADEKPYSMYSDVEFTINKGLLKLDLSYINIDGENSAYCRKYEITIKIDGVDYIYTIDETSDGVTISNNVLYYNMPRRLSLTTGGKTSNKYINSGVDYVVKVKALSENNYLNGRYSSELSFQKTANAEDVVINNGRLEYVVADLENYTGINIKVTVNSVEYLIENITGTAVYDAEDNYLYHYYQFIDGIYNLGATNLQITHHDSFGNPNEYTIKICVVSKNNIINSDFVAVSNVEKVARLDSVDASSVVSQNGIITWQAVTDAHSYVVEVGSYVYETTTNSVDVSTIMAKNGRVLPVGENYLVYITAIGSDKITAIKISAENRFSKLNAVDYSKIGIDSNKVVWEGIENAIGYNIVFEYTNSAGEPTTITEFTSNTYFEAPTDIVGRFTIRIQTVGNEVEGEQFLSSVFTEGWTSSTDNPNPVNSLDYKEELFRFEWKTDNDFEATDKLEITFSLVEFIKDESNEHVEAKNIRYILVNGIEDYYDSENDIYYVNVGNYYDIENETYYFNLIKIGKYSNFTVKVLRDGTVPSSSTMYVDENGLSIINFTIYSYGEGSEENPYRIYNAEHLLNIKHFANDNKYFKLSNNISLKDEIEDYSVLSGYIVAENFNGTLDGDGKNIGDFVNVENGTQTITLTNASEFALFKNLNGASITNLYLGNSESLVKIINLFDENNSDMLKLSLIATGVKNSTITDIRMYSFEIVLNSTTSVTFSGGIQIAALFASVENSTVNNIVVNNFKVELASTISISNKNYDSQIAGAIANATNSNLTNIQVKSQEGDVVKGFVLDVKNASTVTYVGGVVAKYVGNSTTSNRISASVYVNLVNVKSAQVGGIVGYASKVIISSATVEGNIAYENATHSFKVGGVAGGLSDFEIESADVNVNFNFNGMIGSNSYQYLGSVAGFLESSGSIKEWSYDSNNIKTTTISNGVVKIGCCGYSDTNITIATEKN